MKVGIILGHHLAGGTLEVTCSYVLVYFYDIARQYIANGSLISIVIQIFQFRLVRFEASILQLCSYIYIWPRSIPRHGEQ